MGRARDAIPAEVFASAGVSFVELFVADGAVHWVEQRPAEGGRSVLLRLDAAGPVELTPAGADVGSRVYEYGGGAVAVAAGSCYYVDRTDQRVYRVAPGGAVDPLTPADARRYGDLHVDLIGGRLLAVCEDHRSCDLLPPVSVVAVPLTGGEPVTLVEGRDFYASPRVSPDGALLAYVTWSFPNMPWDTTELWVADAAATAAARLVAGGDHESVCQPVWAPDGVLHFISDRTGWWNVYTEAGPVAAMNAEQGWPGALGRAPYDVTETAVAMSVSSNGAGRLAVVDRATGEVGWPLSDARDASIPRCLGTDLCYLAASPRETTAIWTMTFDPPGRADPRRLRSAPAMPITAGQAVVAEALEVPTSDGGVTHAYHYRPPGVTQRPPLVVNAHGGPVGLVPANLRGGIDAPLFWTSRGYAVVDVNYRGSTGYGRDYREALYGRWGQLDVEDCIDTARYLVARGDADPKRVVIRGGSAGGFMTLCALAWHDFFAAGTAYYPVSDLAAFHEGTHKFEARFDEQLVGPYDLETYRRRSPINSVADITAPLLLLQGLDDRICPPIQAEAIFRDLTERDRDVTYLPFPGEGHGFSRAESISASLNAEADFYDRVLGPT